VASLDASIDDLYKEPLDAFTEARAALARSLTGADAQRVKKLVKPNVVPWAVNQVYWHARRTFDAVIATGERLRKAQVAALEGRRADVRAASDAHRRAITEAVKEAERLASAAGSKPAPDALMRTFEALSLASDAPEPFGRLTRPLQPAGFEALGGVKLKAVPGIAPAPQRSPAQKKLSKKEEAARRRAELEEKQRAAAVKRAEAALERARQRVALAEAQLRNTRNREP